MVCAVCVCEGINSSHAQTARFNISTSYSRCKPCVLSSMPCRWAAPRAISLSYVHGVTNAPRLLPCIPIQGAPRHTLHARVLCVCVPRNPFESAPTARFSIPKVPPLLQTMSSSVQPCRRGCPAGTRLHIDICRQRTTAPALRTIRTTARHTLHARVLCVCVCVRDAQIIQIMLMRGSTPRTTAQLRRGTRGIRRVPPLGRMVRAAPEGVCCACGACRMVSAACVTRGTIPPSPHMSPHLSPFSHLFHFSKAASRTRRLRIRVPRSLAHAAVREAGRKSSEDHERKRTNNRPLQVAEKWRKTGGGATGGKRENDATRHP